MDFSKDIAYNGLTVPGSGLVSVPGSAKLDGFQINSIQSSDITVQEYTEKRALADGMFATDIYLGYRKLVIDGGVYGSTRGGAFDHLQAWTGAFSPRLAYNADTANIGFLPFTFYQPTDNTAVWDTNNYPSGIPMQMYLRPMMPPHFDFTNTQGPSKFKGMSIRTLTTLIARDPRKYLRTSQSFNLVNNANLFATPLAYRGDYPTFPVWSANITAALGTATSAYTLSIIYGTVTAGAITINLSTWTSGQLTLDFATRQLVDASGTSQMGLLGTSSTFPEVSAGAKVLHNLQTSGFIGGIATYTMALNYTEAFT